MMCATRTALAWYSETAFKQPMKFASFEDVIDALRKYRGQFFLRDGGCVRHSATHKCPLCVLANAQTNEVFDNHDWSRAARRAGIPYGAASRLVAAADLANGASSQAVADRAALCEALGL
jgi:hypothetical protein